MLLLLWLLWVRIVHVKAFSSIIRILPGPSHSRRPPFASIPQRHRYRPSSLFLQADHQYELFRSSSIDQRNKYLVLSSSTDDEVDASNNEDDSRINVRDWKEGEGEVICKILKSVEAEYVSFNPEGSLDLDCSTESLLQESYNPEDGGCFLVAELVADEDKGDDDAGKASSSSSSRLIGTAGLVVGTPVQYQSSGASLSSGTITGAVRRCCCCYEYGGDQQQEDGGSVSSDHLDATTTAALKKLLGAVEERAIAAQATQLIALAYPSPSSSTTSTTKLGSYAKPHSQLLEELGYELLSTQLRGVDAVQYGKTIGNWQ